MVRLQRGQRPKPSSLTTRRSPHPPQCHLLGPASNGDGVGSRSSVRKTSLNRRSSSLEMNMPPLRHVSSPFWSRITASPQ